MNKKITETEELIIQQLALLNAKVDALTILCNHINQQLEIDAEIDQESDDDIVTFDDLRK